jgi:hypothetical protein
VRSNAIPRTTRWRWVDTHNFPSRAPAAMSTKELMSSLEHVGEEETQEATHEDEARTSAPSLRIAAAPDVSLQRTLSMLLGRSSSLASAEPESDTSEEQLLPEQSAAGQSDAAPSAASAPALPAPAAGLRMPTRAPSAEATGQSSAGAPVVAATSPHAAQMTAPQAPASPSPAELAAAFTVDISSRELATLLDGMGRLRVRPGEEGLPPAILRFEIIGPPMSERILTGVSDLVETGVRGGDVVVVTGDRTVVLVCGGLFFPGDLEVLADRVRARIQAKAPVLLRDAFMVVAGGARGSLGEDPLVLIERAERARMLAASRRDTHALIDYGLGPGVLPNL